jgi:hypothetical protein
MENSKIEWTDNNNVEHQRAIQWHTVEQPKPGKYVLLTVRRDPRFGVGDKPFVIKGVFFRKRFCECDEGVGVDYDNEDKAWYPAGWYEVIGFCEEYSYVSIDAKVVAWAELPKPYEEIKCQK